MVATISVATAWGQSTLQGGCCTHLDIGSKDSGENEVGTYCDFGSSKVVGATECLD